MVPVDVRPLSAYALRARRTRDVYLRKLAKLHLALSEAMRASEAEVARAGDTRGMKAMTEEELEALQALTVGEQAARRAGEEEERRRLLSELRAKPAIRATCGTCNANCHRADARSTPQ